MLLKSQTVSISINCLPVKVYDFVSRLENLPLWAKTFCLSIKKEGDQWEINTPQGNVGIRIEPKNNFGILDHFIKTEAGNEIYVPMRVVPNNNGSEILFTVFQQPDMPDQNFENDIELVKQDLQSLSDILEEK